MTPPPDSGDMNKTDDDPLGGMDPMAWLESLARRQGANPDELITGGTLDVSGTEAQSAAQPAEPSEPEAKPEEVPQPAQPVASIPEPSAFDDVTGGMDPMAWLESLARRQGANPDELVTGGNLEISDTAPVAADEPISQLSGEPTEVLDGNDPMAWLQGLSAAPLSDLGLPEASEPQAPERAMAAEDDPLGGMDPMAWLESLARRQGANPEELVTTADLDIPVPDAAPNEPGYSDYDPFSVKGTSVPTPPVAPRIETPEPVIDFAPQDIVPPTEITIEPPSEPVTEEALPDLMGGMDPMAWLESLARRQGASPDELITFGGGNQPAAPPPTEPEIQTPEVADFSFENAIEPTMSAEEAASLFGAEQPAAGPATFDDPMAWLQSLASGDTEATFSFEKSAEAPQSDIDALEKFVESTPITPDSTLSWLEELAREEVTPLPASEEIAPLDYRPEPQTPTVDPMMAGGLSNDPNEVQAWLERQLESLEANREELERIEQGAEAPAIGGEIPDWLLESMPKDKVATKEMPALSDEIALPDVSDELPPWLTESEMANQEEPALNFSVDELDFISPTEAEAAVSEEPIPALSLEELEELTKPASPEEIDPWAEALDEEYERRLAGDESIPDWYLEALSRVAEPTLEEAAPEIMGEPMAEPELLGAGELPDWLNSLTPEDSEPSEVAEFVAEPPSIPAEDVLPGNIPEWLKTVSSDTVAAPEVYPATEPPPWFSAEAAPVVEAVISETPSGEPIVEAAEPVGTAEAVPEVVSETPAGEPVTIVPPEPIVSQPAPVQPSPARPPVELPALLIAARKQVEEGQLLPALEHYQTLVDNSTLLEETRGDLRVLAEKNKEPKIFRLLGDTHMRLGDLEAALETYLSALDQL
jgi:hypothetical protein